MFLFLRGTCVLSEDMVSVMIERWQICYPWLFRLCTHCFCWSWECRQTGMASDFICFFGVYGKHSPDYIWRAFALFSTFWRSNLPHNWRAFSASMLAESMFGFCASGDASDQTRRRCIRCGDYLSSLSLGTTWLALHLLFSLLPFSNSETRLLSTWLF